MKRLSLFLFAAGLGLALLGAAPPPSPETLLEQGNQALRDGNFNRAIELYEKAEPRAADPGLVTMNLALAKYALAVNDGSVSDMYQAAQLYRCLLDKNDPRRAAALLGLGNCYLQKAGTRDARSVLTAIDAYEQCLQAATAAQDDKLTTDAQYNLERARLLLHQIRRAEDEKQPPDKEPQNGNPPQPKDPQQQPTPNDQKNPGAPPKPNSGMGEPVQPQPGEKPIETDQPPPAGKGNLQPVPDKPDLPPLSAEEAKEHLKQANERIWRERHQHRIGLAKPPAADVRDW